MTRERLILYAVYAFATLWVISVHVWVAWQLSKAAQ